MSGNHIGSASIVNWRRREEEDENRKDVRDLEKDASKGRCQ
jgi:hypothetical protein